MKVRTAAKRAAIVAAAAELFQELGYDGASMNELVKRLGGSKATLYGYFPSKEALFAEVVRSVAIPSFSNAILELQRAMAEGRKAEPALTRFGQDVLQVAADDRAALAVYRMVVAEAGRSEAGQIFMQAGTSEAMQTLGKLLKVFMDNGELRRIDPDISAHQLMALITAETNSRLFQRDPPKVSKAEVRRMAARAIEAFLLGAAPRR